MHDEEPSAHRDRRTTARIRLAAAADDGPALAEIYRPAVVDSVISFELEPPDAAEMARRVARTAARFPWLVCERGGELLGYAYASAHRERPAYRWSVDVSAYVRGDVRRGGVGRALYTSLFAALALQGFRTAFAGIALPNDASVGLHRAVGFAPVGVYRHTGYKLGAWHDVAWFERALGEYDAAPNEPTPLPALANAPALARALARASAAGAPLLRLT